jgi:hypothetical protein
LAALFYGNRDQLVDSTDLTHLVNVLRDPLPAAEAGTRDGPGHDVDRSRSRFPTDIDDDLHAELLVEEIPTYNHTDYLWDSEADRLLYPQVLRFLQRHSM